MTEINIITKETHIVHSRLAYVVDFLNTIFDLTFRIKSEKTGVSTDSFNIIYSSKEEEQEELFTIYACNKEIDNHPPFTEDPSFRLYPSPKEKNFSIQYDIFKSIFFMLSRWEEYDSEKDHHQRFGHTSSFLFQHHQLQTPIVDYWILDLKESLQEKFHIPIELKQRQKIISTVDVDTMYAYKHGNLFHTCGALIKNIIQRDFSLIKQKYKVLTGQEEDPFDNFNTIRKLHSDHNIKPLVFIHCGDFKSYDRPNSFRHDAFKKIVQQLEEFAEIGIHPSYHSLNNRALIQEEIHRLEDIIGKKVTKSRFHYLRFNLPSSYEDLISCGITEDYSMGYSQTNGFRAGTTFAFPFYNIEDECTRPLVIHPLHIMDTTTLMYENMKNRMKVVSEIKNCNGTLYSLIHNNYLKEKGEQNNLTDLFYAHED